jgi:hypothetical protein
LLNQETGGNIQYNAAGSWGAMSTSIAASGVTPAQMLFPMGLSVEAQQNAPPGSPVAGDGLYYLVGTSPSGAWSGQANDIATYDATSTWVFLDAYAGATIYNKASSAQLVWFEHGRLGAAVADCVDLPGPPDPVERHADPTSDLTAQATLYFTPFRGNAIALYVNGGWALRTFTEVSLSLSGYTTGKPTTSSATTIPASLAIESLVWTNDTVRATALTTAGRHLRQERRCDAPLSRDDLHHGHGQTEDSRSAQAHGVERPSARPTPAPPTSSSSCRNPIQHRQQRHRGR